MHMATAQKVPWVIRAISVSRNPRPCKHTPLKSGALHLLPLAISAAHRSQAGSKLVMLAITWIRHPPKLTAAASPVIMRTRRHQ